MLTNADVTIYNKVKQQGVGSESFKRIEIKEVYWHVDREIIGDNNGFKKANILTVLIPKKSLDSIDKEYLEPKQWQLCSNKENSYTFQDGDKVVRGIIKDEIITTADLDKKYDNVYTITTIADNRYGSEEVQHFSLIGK